MRSQLGPGQTFLEEYFLAAVDRRSGSRALAA